MPLIVKLKRPGASVSSALPIPAPGAQDQPLGPKPSTPTNEATPSLSVLAHHPQHGGQVAMTDADPGPLKIEQPSTPASGLRIEELKSPIDTAMQDSTPAAVDVLIAPSCLQHRYVRSHDISAIVERPERLRAVLLGVSATIGRALTSGADLVPSACAVLPKQEEEEEDDDLASRLEGMSLSKGKDGAGMGSAAVNVWLCNRSLALQPPHPAVAFVHAHPDEDVPNPNVPEYALSQGTNTFSNLTHLPPTGPGQSKQEQEGGQDVLVKEEEGLTDSKTQDSGITFASYLSELCRLAPPAPPDRTTDDPDRTLPSPHPLEVPNDYPQGDLYLRGPHAGPEREDGDGGSGDAIRHALGACAEAVDRVVVATTTATPTNAPSPESEHLSYLPLPDDAFQHGSRAPSAAPMPSRRNFVLTRPPGHHCSGNQPAGFYGTQNLAWRINRETLQADTMREERMAERQRALASSNSPRPTRHHPALHNSHKSNNPTTASSEDAPPLEKEGEEGRRGLKIFYGSLHDIESYPCETGEPDLVRDASVCVEGAHGQWIWNVHLDSYASPSEFNTLYTSKYATLFKKAHKFALQTSSTPSKTLILISAGFDACTHEYSSMSRHGRSVPVEFYARFAADAVRLAEGVAGGKVVGLLEGGYSERALCSGAMAFVGGLAGYVPSSSEGEGRDCAEWWDLDSLGKLEKAAGSGTTSSTPQGAGGAAGRRKPKALSASNPAWLSSAMAVFGALEVGAGLRPEGERGGGAGGEVGLSPAGGRVLRDRTKGRVVSGAGPGPSPAGSPSATRTHKVT
ncbi:unnamed protein product [Tilletia laevis]|uniref:Histone deacetylase domain-containing protein n=1 Tax=Tilletia laevis TaxID=157183 RepID=A0A9N8QPT6_9BASI|nr:unnamed protein product [Tilletia laevis]